MRGKPGKMIPKRIREGVWLRELGRCIHCGGHGSDIHHRQRRRDGGHTMTNCVLLCRPCHDKMHREPGLARRFGLIVSAHTPVEDIHLHPVRGARGWLLIPEQGINPVFTQVPSGDSELHYLACRTVRQPEREEDTP